MERSLASSRLQRAACSVVVAAQELCGLRQELRFPGQEVVLTVEKAQPLEIPQEGYTHMQHPPQAPVAVAAVDAITQT